MCIVEDKHHFVRLSQYAGERFDLTQSGGGNSSVKLDDGNMIIKASGHLLSGIDDNNGYVFVDLKKVLEIFEDNSLTRESNKRLREKKASSLIKDSLVYQDGENRPSIETFLHALLYKYTLHTHPIAVNMLTCRKEWKERLKNLFSNAVYIKYETPGIELALELKKECENYYQQKGVIPEIIFLQNHGLIVSSDDPNRVYSLTNEVVETIEKEMGINLYRYRLSNELSSVMRNFGNKNALSYLSEDELITKKINSNRSLLTYHPLCPDTLVFCGIHAVEVNNEKEVQKIKEFFDTYHKLPKVVMYKGYLFFISNSLKKAKEAEEVYKAHIITLENVYGDENSLPVDELQYLDNWEAEKFRQKI